MAHALGAGAGSTCMSGKSKGLSVERKGIDFVPTTERYGTPRRLFTVWFSVNLSILCLTVGTLGVVAGLPLGWTLGGLVLGNAVGTFFMAAHSAQGPHLGIPQMIQSRAQFGVLGAGLPLVAVVTSQTLYAAANAILIQDTIRMLLPVSGVSAIVWFATITVVIAFFGYELIHRVGVLLTILSGALVLGIIVALVNHASQSHAAPLHAAHFSIAAFIMVVAQSTAWSLSTAPTVADYSRYLPITVSLPETFWYTGMGNFFGSLLMMSLGAYLAASLPDFIGHSGVGISELFGNGRYVAAVLITLNLLQVNVMVLYSAYMSAATIVSGIRGMKRVPLSMKLFVMLLLMGIATTIAILTRDSFDRYFSDLLALLVYFLIPWSAINLADYYVVRKGAYSIEQMFLIDGIYGRFRWKTLGVYLVSIAAQIPFMNLSFYAGPVARLTGADMAWLPGTVIPTLLYLWVERVGHRSPGVNAFTRPEPLPTAEDHMNP
jgi:nucleobase:cation symporter-1, NCS1 family